MLHKKLTLWGRYGCTFFGQDIGNVTVCNSFKGCLADQCYNATAVFSGFEVAKSEGEANAITER